MFFKTSKTIWNQLNKKWGRKRGSGGEKMFWERDERREKESQERGKFCTLRFCHDEAEPTHSLDRKKVEEVECLKCSTRYWEVSLYFVKPHPMSPKNNRIWQGPCWSWMQAMWGCLWLCLLLQRLQVISPNPTHVHERIIVLRVLCHAHCCPFGVDMMFAMTFAQVVWWRWQRTVPLRGMWDMQVGLILSGLCFKLKVVEFD